MNNFFSSLLMIIGVLIYAVFNIFLYGAGVVFSLWVFYKVVNWLF